MAVRRRRPRGTLIHSDQGTQYGSDAWRRFCRSNHLEPSMSRKGNCWDNAVAESFFSSLKKERIKKQIYKNRELAIADVADYIDSLLQSNAPPQSSRRRQSGAVRSRSEAASTGSPLNPGNSTFVRFQSSDTSSSGRTPRRRRYQHHEASEIDSKSFVSGLVQAEHRGRASVAIRARNTNRGLVKKPVILHTVSLLSVTEER